MASRNLLSYPFVLAIVFLLLLLAFEATMTSALGGGRTLGLSSPVPASVGGNSTAFIRASCGATRYPRLCYASLSAYAGSVEESPVALARLAANVTAARLRALSTSVAALRRRRRRRRRRRAPPREAAALRDCSDAVGDAADLARRAGAKLAGLDAAAAAGGRGGGGRAEAAWRVANAQTWLSAALTDEDTCRDGFEGVAPSPGAAKGEVLAHVGKVKQYTSNALALVNSLVARAP